MLLVFIFKFISEFRSSTQNDIKGNLLNEHDREFILDLKIKNVRESKVDELKVLGWNIAVIWLHTQLLIKKHFKELKSASVDRMKDYNWKRMRMTEKSARCGCSMMRN